MRALTLWPEWAALVAQGLKPVENRSWRLPEGERIAIHAGAHVGGRKGLPAVGEANEAVGQTALDAGWETEVLPNGRILLRDAVVGGQWSTIPIVCSAVVCTAVVGMPRRPAGAPWESVHPDTWVNPLVDVVRLRTPVPVARGALGLWPWTDWGDLVCPMCGIPCKWSMSTSANAGHADCQDGTRVSRRWPAIAAEPCEWAGAPIRRNAAGRLEFSR